MNTFSSRLNQAIAMSGLTQKQVAEEARITEVSLSRYVTGKRIPNINTVVALCSVFNCSADWLLERE